MSIPYLACILFLCVACLPSSSDAACMLCGPGFPELDERLSEAKSAVIDWLMREQRGDGSWPPASTAESVLGLQLADRGWLNGQDLNGRHLTKARLEYELLRYLVPQASADRAQVQERPVPDSNESRGRSRSESGSTERSSRGHGRHSSSSAERRSRGHGRHSSSSAERSSRGRGRPSTSASADRIEEVRTRQCGLQGFSRGAGTLGQYMLALQSVCCDTDDFYGVDLDSLMTRLLRDFPQENFNNFFQYSLAILSLCSQGSETNIPKRALRRLAVGSNRDDPCGSDPHSVDTLSMQVMAMVCARPQAMVRGLGEWEDIIDARVQCIVASQRADCSFGGNTITTALALQALSAVGAAPVVCPCDVTADFLLDVLDQEGYTRENATFTVYPSVGSIAQIIPIFNCNNFGSFANASIDCPNYDLAPAPFQPGDLTTSFKLLVDDGSTVIDYGVMIIQGESLYTGLLRLEDSGVGFTFGTLPSSFGRFLVSLNGVPSSSTDFTYWSIVEVEGGVEGLANSGIEGLFPVEDDCYIIRLTSYA